MGSTIMGLACVRMVMGLACVRMVLVMPRAFKQRQ